MSKQITEMTVEEFRNVPCRPSFDYDIGTVDSIVILPCDGDDAIHDSGYRYMEFVACVGGRPLYRCGGCSDVINLDGIGGLGRDIGKRVLNVWWSIDCLPVSGLLNLFARQQLTVGADLSSFEVFADAERRK